MSPKLEDEFTPGKEYKVAYRPTRYAAYHNALDTLLMCPVCENDYWKFSNRTGTKVLNADQLKFKCTKCGQWFICNKNEITKVLGS